MSHTFIAPFFAWVTLFAASIYPLAANADIPIQARFRTAFEFPCDITKALKPRLVLIPYAEGARWCEVEACKKLEEAGEGKNFVGIGNLYSDTVPASEDLKDWFDVDVTDVSHIAGYEHEFTHGIATILRTIRELEIAILSHEETAVEMVRDSFIQTGIEQRYIKEAWENLLKEKTFERPSEQKVANIIQNSMTEADKEKRAKKFASAFYKFETDPHAFLKVLHALLQSYADMAESQKYKDAMLVPEGLRQIVDGFLAGIDQNAALDLITSEWPNQFRAPRVAALYCKAIEANLDLYIFIGERDLRGMSKLLNQMSNGEVNLWETVAPHKRRFRGFVVTPKMVRRNDSRIENRGVFPDITVPRDLPAKGRP